MKPLVVSSNMWNERHQLDEWFDFVYKIADGGILIVDTGSVDGTETFFMDKEDKNGNPVIFYTKDTIRSQGYGPARNELRELSKKHFPKAKWMVYLDGDERILPEDFHTLRFLKDYLESNWDVIALPRIDWHDKEMTKAEKDVYVNPDWQARMTRLDSNLQYVRRLHEQVTNFTGIYTHIDNPKLHHFHRCTSKEVRDRIGRMCAYLHSVDEHGNTYPKHHKEDQYMEEFKEKGF